MDSSIEGPHCHSHCYHAYCLFIPILMKVKRIMNSARLCIKEEGKCTNNKLEFFWGGGSWNLNAFDLNEIPLYLKIIHFFSFRLKITCVTSMNK